MEGSPVYRYAGSRKVAGSVERWLERRKETRKQEKKDAEEMLFEEIISKSNMRLAYQKVIGNKGAAGVDGIGVADFAGHLKAEWGDVKTKLETDSYQPQAVKRVKIPKPNGGERKLGIPTYMDRLIQ
jgi:retron-type reverse transcriptase